MKIKPKNKPKVKTKAKPKSKAQSKKDDLLLEFARLNTDYIHVVGKQRNKGGKHYVCQCLKCSRKFMSEAWRIQTLKDCGCSSKKNVSIIGKRFGLNTVINTSGSKLECLCVCNKTRILSYDSVVNEKPCKCESKEIRPKLYEYDIYKELIKTNQVSAEWQGKLGFNQFIKDMGRMPFNGYSLQRQIISQPFSKTNCQWFDSFADIHKRAAEETITYKGALADFLNTNNTFEDFIWYGKSILAMDPGTKNFAFAWVKDANVCAAGILSQAIQSIKLDRLGSSSSNFMEEIERLIDQTKPDIIVIERFMVRAFGTKLIELISFMLGVIAIICKERGIALRLITPAQWKTAAKKTIDLKKLYAEGRKYNLPPHPLDAMCMARYVMSNFTFNTHDFVWLNDNTFNCTKTITPEIQP